jgi:hypothetical protein
MDIIPCPSFKILCTLPSGSFKTKYVQQASYQCWGSMTFWCGSGSGCGSADPCLRLMDPGPDSDPDVDPDPSIFIIDLQDANKKQFKKKSKRSHKTVEIKVFLTIFAL